MSEMGLSEGELERMVHEVYAAHAVYMRLGFLPEEIFVSVPWVLDATPPGHYAVVTLRRGDLQFVYWMDPIANESEGEAFCKAWSAFSHAQPAMDRKVLDDIVLGSRVYADRVRFLSALTAKGFMFDVVLN